MFVRQPLAAEKCYTSPACEIAMVRRESEYLRDMWCSRGLRFRQTVFRSKENLTSWLRWGQWHCPTCHYRIQDTEVVPVFLYPEMGSKCSNFQASAVPEAYAVELVNDKHCVASSALSSSGLVRGVHSPRVVSTAGKLGCCK
jgi:hypothetical protein